jgi:hypothetical protein
MQKNCNFLLQCMIWHSVITQDSGCGCLSTLAPKMDWMAVNFWAVKLKRAHIFLYQSRPHTLTLAMTQHQFLPQGFCPLHTLFSPHIYLFYINFFHFWGPASQGAIYFLLPVSAGARGLSPRAQIQILLRGLLPIFGAQCPGAFDHCNTHFLIWGLLPTLGRTARG